MANLEVMAGAAIAALILLISSLVTLFAQDATLTFQHISQATWVSIVGGALVAFLKDYQAIFTRQLVSTITRRPPYEPGSQNPPDAP